MRKKIVYYILIFTLILFVSCGENNKITFNQEADPINAPATLVSIKPGDNTINLEDFIIDFTGVDSVYYIGGEYQYDSKSHLLNIFSDPETSSILTQILIRKDGFEYCILCRRTSKVKKEILFNTINENEYEQVSIAGDFNAWNSNTDKLVKSSDGWKIFLELDPGMYQYQIVADGKWMNNSKYGDTVPNGVGGYNTLLNTTSACDASKIKLYAKRFDDSSVTISVSDIPEQLFILWQNQVIPVDLGSFSSHEYTFNIPIEAQKTKRSYIRVYASCNNCIANDLLIPLNYGKVLYNVADVERGDKFSNIMYFVLVDRFCNGINTNDFKLNDPKVADKANYQGGDLYGVLQKLNEGYFDKLGVSCLWISPVFRNPDEAYQEYPAPHRYYSGYHGYWPISSTEIDYRLGNDSVFKALTDAVHDKNMNIILDFVANHVHEKHPLYQSHRDWATQLNLPNGKQNIRLWDEYRLTTWFDTFLPSWDFDNLAVTDTVSELAMYWLTKFEIDGFRHDATKHIPEVFWRTLTRKIKTKFPNKSIYQIGETFGSRELISDYVGSGMMDGQFDFNLYFDARNCFAGSNYDISNLALSLKTSLAYYGYHNLMGNITGNHDLIRFITYADGSVKPGEDDKEAGWDRNIEVENPNSYRKLQCLTAFVMSIPGIPCIYYGDEIGLPGAGDPDNRRMMKFDDLSKYEKETFDIYSNLVHIRKNNIEMMLGDLIIVEAGKNNLVLKRSYFDRETYVIFNQSDSVSDVLVSKNEIPNINLYKINFKSEITELSSNYQIRLQPYSFEIITKK